MPGDGRGRGGSGRLPRRSARVRVHRATPYLVKSHIRSLGLKAKTDRIDARALARYGAARGADLAPYRPPPESQRELAAVLTRREVLRRRSASVFFFFFFFF